MECSAGRLARPCPLRSADPEVTLQDIDRKRGFSQTFRSSTDKVFIRFQIASEASNGILRYPGAHRFASAKLDWPTNQPGGKPAVPTCQIFRPSSGLNLDYRDSGITVGGGLHCAGRTAP